MTNGQQFTGLRNVWNPCEMFRFKSNVSAGFFHVKPVTATVRVNDGLLFFFFLLPQRPLLPRVCTVTLYYGTLMNNRWLIYRLETQHASTTSSWAGGEWSITTMLLLVAVWQEKTWLVLLNHTGISRCSGELSIACTLSLPWGTLVSQKRRERD